MIIIAIAYECLLQITIYELTAVGRFKNRNPPKNRNVLHDILFAWFLPVRFLSDRIGFVSLRMFVRFRSLSVGRIK